MTCLLGQAFHAARVSRDDLDTVLGPAEDLLVWILKFLGARDANGMRPLQLPSCFRRLFGAALASFVGPKIEPKLSVHQPAVAGGACGPNIRRAYRHLQGLHEAPEGPTDLWHNVVGEGSRDLLRQADEAQDPFINRTPADLLRTRAKPSSACPTCGS